MVKALLESNLTVMVIMVGDASTRTFAYNTQATLRTYEAIAQQTGKPVIARYYQNHVDAQSTIERINTAIAYSITDYRVLFSGKIHGVDSSDLINFFAYHKVTQSRPSLTLISNTTLPVSAESNALVETLNKQLGNNCNIISVVSIQTTENANRQVINCDFRVEGLLEYGSNKSEEDLHSLYFVLTDNYYFDVVQTLKKTVEDYDKHNRTRVVAQIDVGNTDSNGLVL